MEQRKSRLEDMIVRDDSFIDRFNITIMFGESAYDRAETTRSFVMYTMK